MPITLGARPQADFGQPLGLLSDCHRRIEHFLGVLVKIASRDGGVLDEEHRRAVQTCLNYFSHSAPKHNADEEESLFPRLRELAGSNARIAEAMAKLDRLEADHQAADAALAEVREWFERWLDVGTLAPSQLERLQSVLHLLQELYRNHIEVEDSHVFTLAGEVLEAGALNQIGQEMAARRGLSASA